MRRFALWIIAVITLSGWVSEAKADVYDGDQLYQECQSPADTSPVSHGFCIGYIAGAYDMLEGLSSGAGSNLVCLPSNVQTGELVDVVKTYLQENPDERLKPAMFNVLTALNVAFPC